MRRRRRGDAAHSTATTKPDSESDTPDAGVPLINIKSASYSARGHRRGRPRLRSVCAGVPAQDARWAHPAAAGRRKQRCPYRFRRSRRCRYRRRWLPRRRSARAKPPSLARVKGQGVCSVSTHCPGVGVFFVAQSATSFIRQSVPQMCRPGLPLSAESSVSRTNWTAGESAETLNQWLTPSFLAPH